MNITTTVNNRGARNVYFSSERFTQWASPETLAEIAAKATLTGGATADSALPGVLLEYFRLEFNDIYTDGSSAKVDQEMNALAASVLDALILQKSLK